MKKLLPLLIVILIGFILFANKLNLHKNFTLSASSTGTPINDTPVTKHILLLIFNPILESQGGAKVTDYFNWSDPDILTNKIMNQFSVMSHGYITYDIAERQLIDGYYTKISGYSFNDASFLACMNKTGPCNSEGIDYQKLFNDFGVCNKNVDEVWIWGGPYFGYYEYNPVTYCGKTTFVMGFNYERQLGEALHDFGHRMEYVAMNRVGNGIWRQAEDNEWDKFSLVNGHCGNVHYPPGSQIPADEYNYSNTKVVTTDCDSYNTYPISTSTTTILNCNAWSCSQDGYLEWWLGHIPHSTGMSTSMDLKTIYNNWWKYYAFYDDTLTPLPPLPGAPTPTPTPVASFTNLNADLLSNKATFNFTYLGSSSNNFVVDMSITPDMSTGTYLTFTQGPGSPLIETNPTKWDHYLCGADFWWTVKNVFGDKSPIIHSTVNCVTPTPVPTIAPTPTPSPTLSPTLAPTPTPTPKTLTFVVSADATLQKSSPTKNYGTAKTDNVDNSPVTDYLIKFIVSGTTEKTIKSAYLQLYDVDSSNMGGAFYTTSNSWTESAVTWNNAPTYGTLINTLGSVKGSSSKPAIYKVDLTPTITGDGTYSFRVKSTSSDGADFYSKEAASQYRPQLSVIVQ